MVVLRIVICVLWPSSMSLAGSAHNPVEFPIGIHAPISGPRDERQATTVKADLLAAADSETDFAKAWLPEMHLSMIEHMRIVFARCINYPCGVFLYSAL